LARGHESHGDSRDSGVVLVLAEATETRSSHPETLSRFADDTDGDFDIVYRAYASDVERFIRRYVNDRTHAEDLVQETFLRAFNVWRGVDRSKPLGPWLRTIAMRLCIDTWRRKTSGPTECAEAGAAESLVSKEGNPAEVFVANARKECVTLTLEELTPRQRRILLLKDLHGLRYDEIARLEGTTLAALRCSLAVARRRFRERYAVMADERGVNSVLWPIFLRAFAGLRSLKRRGLRLAEVVQHPSLLINGENLISAPAMQVSSGILAAAIALGSLPFTSHVPSSTQFSSAHAPTFSFDAVSRSTSLRLDAPAQLMAAPAAGVSSSPASDPGAPQQTITPDPKAIAPVAPTPVVAPPVSDDPPVHQDDLTDPNKNVSQPEDARMSSFAVAPDGQTVFAAGRNLKCAGQVTCPATLFVTHDGGTTWTHPAASGFDGDALLMSPGFGSTDNRIFATDPAGLLMVSADDGASFKPAAVGAPQFQGAADISPAFDSGDPKIVVGSQPSMVQYDDVTKAMEPAAYSALPGDVNPVFVTKDLLMAGGKMLDESGTWRPAVFTCDGPVCTGVRVGNGGIKSPELRLSPAFQTNHVVFAFTDHELFRSADGGGTFSSITMPWSGASLVDLAISPTGDEMFAAVQGPHRDNGSGLYTSSDNGASWTRVASPLFDQGLSAVKVAGGRIFAGLAGGGVACSSDLGSAWATRC